MELGGQDTRVPQMREWDCVVDSGKCEFESEFYHFLFGFLIPPLYYEDNALII